MKTIRWSLIGVIALVLLAVFFNYLQTSRRRSRAVKPAPQILGSEMKRSADSVDIVESRGGVPRFKIHARKLMETLPGKSILQGIEAYDLNPDGTVRNEIRSQNAEYDPERKVADFSGNVRVFISRRLELRVDSLHYDVAAGIGSTADLVRVYSDQVNGTARGIRFDHKQKTLSLAREVDFSLLQRWKKEGAEPDTGRIHTTSDRAHYSEAAQRIVFEGNVRIDSGAQTLSGERIDAVLDPAGKRISSLMAEGSAMYQSKDANEVRTLAGNRMQFGISPSGTLQKIVMSDQASFSSASLSGRQDLRGQEIEIDFDAKELPAKIQSRSAVSLSMARGTQNILLSGEQLDAKFTAGTSYLENIQVVNKKQGVEQARMLVNDAAGSQASELQADDIRIKLRQVNGNPVPDTLRAEGKARYTSRPTAKDGRPAPARSLSASLLEMVQSGTADSFESGSASGNVVISEEPGTHAERPSMKQMTADRARFLFFPGGNQLKELDAEGNVRTAYQKEKAEGKALRLEEFRTSSNHLKAKFVLKAGESSVESVSQWGNFKYSDGTRSAASGRCDYDANRNILVLRESPKLSDETKSTSGERIEYDQNGKLLTARGRVRSVLSAEKGQGSFFGSSSSSSPGIVTAEEMNYWTGTGRVRYTGKIQLLSENQQLQADMLEIAGSLEQVDARGSVRHLVPMQKAPGTGVSAAPEPAVIRSSEMKYMKTTNTIAYSGKVTLDSKDVDISSDSLDATLDREGKKVEHAKAKGSVAIKAFGRSGKGDVADYYADPERFVVAGRPAEVYDPGKKIRSAARRLTSFSADDRILLENK